MAEQSEDEGVILALFERFEKYRLPRALDIKERVDQGEKLTDVDIDFLKEVFEGAKHIKPYLDKHPEYESVVSQTVDLYHQITSKALNNEEAG